ncbi:MAG: hypothetical protein KDG55_06510 [Rhodocyclaceae bacterium]|nr:hypothetical protein [Rhodocyclaceae bacterium]
MPNANQETIGENLYFFRSPVANCAHCLIFGHAGWVPRLADQFQVPMGVTLNFRSWHGSPNVSNPTHEILDPRARYDRDEALLNRSSPKVASMLLDQHEKKTFVGGESCCKYVIVKGVGKHWDKQNPGQSSYSELSRLVGLAAGTGKPVHFVSVRNRRYRGAARYQTLGDVIDQVIQHEPLINQFVMAGCRGVHPDWNP